MSRALSDLESLLRQMTGEHGRLLEQVERQHDAMRRMDAAGIEQATRLQDAARLRIAALDGRRRALLGQIQKSIRLPAEPTVQRLAELFPQFAPQLLSARDDLKTVAREVAARTTVAHRLATAVLGQLNTIVRCLASKSAKQGGVYTPAGTHRLAARIGGMEAVG